MLDLMFTAQTASLEIRYCAFHMLNLMFTAQTASLEIRYCAFHMLNLMFTAQTDLPHRRFDDTRRLEHLINYNVPFPL